MEIVFVLQKTEVVQDKRITFESVWGMPISGTIGFTQLDNGRTEVELEFAQALPDLLVDLKVGVFGVQSSLLPIFSDNLTVFRSIAEAAARDPGALPPRAEAGQRAYTLFDEDADLALFVDIMENLDLSDEEDLPQQQQQDEASQAGASSGAAPGQQGPGTAAPAATDAEREPGPEGSSAGSGTTTSGSRQAKEPGGSSDPSAGRPARGRATAGRAAAPVSGRSGARAAGSAAGRSGSGSGAAADAAPKGSDGGAGTAAKKRSARARGAT